MPTRKRASAISTDGELDLPPFVRLTRGRGDRLEKQRADVGRGRTQVHGDHGTDGPTFARELDLDRCQLGEIRWGETRERRPSRVVTAHRGAEEAEDRRLA